MLLLGGLNGLLRAVGVVSERGGLGGSYGQC